MSNPRLFRKRFFDNGGETPFTSATSASAGQILPQSTITVVSTAGFPSSGTLILYVYFSSLNAQITTTIVNYTGITATTFTGCTGGTGTLILGAHITLYGSVLNSTWTCPAGIKYVTISGCGGGGGGGSGASASGWMNGPSDPISFAGGGSGGHAAPTISQTIEVIPGTIYNILLGQGGIGGVAPCIKGYTGDFDGSCRPGDFGFDGAISSFGSINFPGGKGGKGGKLISINSLTFTLGQNCLSSFIGTGNPDLQTISALAESANFATNNSLHGLSHAKFRALGTPNKYSISGGGTAGGVSNNFYSTGGNGGYGGQGIDGDPYPLFGGFGTFGGGGGGGGGGENWDFHDTGNGASGGKGGSGFIEISWVN